MPQYKTICECGTESECYTNKETAKWVMEVLHKIAHPSARYRVVEV
jgi:hypothetical protein